MYHWVTDKEFLGRMNSLCADVVNQLKQAINSEGRMYVQQHMIGSGKRNLILQNAKKPIDLDYNLEILDFGEFQRNDCKKIKEYIQGMFDVVLARVGWKRNCKDSTSVLTTGLYRFSSGNLTEFKIDLCITYRDSSGRWYRLIHRKTGFIQHDPFFWNESPQSVGLEEKVNWLKDVRHNHWPELREKYKEKKNMYLTRNDHDHHSFQIYIEAINEVYEKYHGKQNPGFCLLQTANSVNSGSWLSLSLLE